MKGLTKEERLRRKKVMLMIEQNEKFAKILYETVVEGLIDVYRSDEYISNLDEEQRCLIEDFSIDDTEKFYMMLKDEIAYAIVRMLGITDGSASTVDDYIDVEMSLDGIDLEQCSCDGYIEYLQTKSNVWGYENKASRRKRKNATNQRDYNFVGQKSIMNMYMEDYDVYSAPVITVPRVGYSIINGKSGIVSRKMTNISSLRQLIARDILELRRMYPDIPNSAYWSLIGVNQAKYPKDFIKNSKFDIQNQNEETKEWIERNRLFVRLIHEAIEMDTVAEYRKSGSNLAIFARDAKALSASMDSKEEKAFYKILKRTMADTISMVFGIMDGTIPVLGGGPVDIETTFDYEDLGHCLQDFYIEYLEEHTDILE